VARAGTASDYATREHAGKPHKGKITDTEKQLVHEHLDEINERLAGQGLRVISLTDPEHVERYGLQDLARERNLELEFGLRRRGGTPRTAWTPRSRDAVSDAFAPPGPGPARGRCGGPGGGYRPVRTLRRRQPRSQRSMKP
jgi:hypothetical protein